MPNFNKGKFVGDAIESVLAQSYGDLELIVVDDGSSDGSIAIIEAYAAKERRVVLLRGPHKGVSAARNMGIETAHGELVTFLDSDDIYHKDKLLKQVQALEGAEEKKFVSYTAGWVIDENGKPTGQIYGRNLERVPFETRDGNIFSNILRFREISRDGRSVALISILAPVEFLRLEEFDPQCSYGEDWDLWVRLAHRFPFRYLPEALYGYRFYPGNKANWSTEARIRRMKDGIAFRRKWLRMFNDLAPADRDHIVREILRCYRIMNDYPGMLGYCLTSKTAFRVASQNLLNRRPGPGTTAE